MKGSQSEPGIIPLSLKYIFEKFEEISKNKLGKDGKVLNYQISLNYVEIYNETINDLLKHKNSNLRMMMKEDKSLFIQNLSEIPVENFEESLNKL